MKVKLIKGEDVETLNHGTVTAKNLLNSEEYENLSIVELEKVGEKKVGMNPKSEIFYYILEGRGTFTVNNTKYKVKKGDLVVIPRGNKYTHSYGIKVLAISSPRHKRVERIRYED